MWFLTVLLAVDTCQRYVSPILTHLGSSLSCRPQTASGDLEDADADLEGTQEPAAAGQEEEGRVIGRANAIVQPIAVVVEIVHTPVTSPAVLAALLHVCLQLHQPLLLS